MTVNFFKSGIFVYRRGQKIGVAEGWQNKGANITVGSGQCFGLVEAVGKNFQNSEIGNIANNTLKGIDEVAKGTGTASRLATGLKWAGKHVNPLISLATLVKISTSKNKKEATCTDGLGLLAMFGGEKCIKKFLASKCFSSICTAIGVASPQMKIASLLVSGLTFVGASIGSACLGAKVGQMAYDNLLKKDNKHPFIHNNALASNQVYFGNVQQNMALLQQQWLTKR